MENKEIYKNYFNRYKKYKKKYLELKQIIGGSSQVYEHIMVLNTLQPYNDISRFFDNIGWINVAQTTNSELVEQFKFPPVNNINLPFKIDKEDRATKLLKITRNTGNGSTNLSINNRQDTDDLRNIQISSIQNNSGEFGITLYPSRNRNIDPLSFTNDECLIRGTQLIKLMLAIAYKIGLKTLNLADSAILYDEGHELYLSIILLLKNKEPYYDRFGFKYNSIVKLKRIIGKYKPLYQEYKNNKEFCSELTNFIRNHNTENKIITQYFSENVNEHINSKDWKGTKSLVLNDWITFYQEYKECRFVTSV